MMPAALNNPFLAQKLDTTVALPPGDVPELHIKVREKCRAVLAQAQQSGQSIGLLVVGEAGSGKSHLIAQLRQELLLDGRVVLATIRLHGAHGGRLWRHVRAKFVEELFQQYPDRTDRLNGLLRLLRNRFPKWASAQNATGGLLGVLLGKSKTSLQPFLDEFAHTCTLDYALQKVLSKLESPHLTTLAQAWLRGQQLGSQDLASLGLPGVFPSEQQQEHDAREVVLSLFRLAGTATTLFICFDEVEAIQAGSYDAASLRQFTTLTTDLLAEAGPRVVTTFLRPNCLLELRKAVEVSNLQKMGQDSTVIPLLIWEQAVRLTKARLEAEPSCRNARLDHPNDSFWPLGQEFVKKVFEEDKRSLTPRHLIRACAVGFERLQKGEAIFEPERSAVTNDCSSNKGKSHQQTVRHGGVQSDGIDPPIILVGVVDPPPPPPTPPANDEEFVRMWEKQRQKFLKKPQGIQFDTVMAIALPWFVNLAELPLDWIQEPELPLGDVNLVFQSKVRGRKLIGISFCNQDPRSLWRRLDRLLAQWTVVKGKTFGSLVVLRSQAERTPEGSESRLTALVKAGARVVRVEQQQLAELAAYQVMLTAAQAGDLTRSGKPIEAAEYGVWVKGVLSGAVKEFLDLVFTS